MEELDVGLDSDRGGVWGSAMVWLWVKIDGDMERILDGLKPKNDGDGYTEKYVFKMRSTHLIR